jgi:hypothetical protein
MKYSFYIRFNKVNGFLFQNPTKLYLINFFFFFLQIESPSRFWVQQSDDIWSKKILWLHVELNKPGSHVPLKGPVKLGRLCLAPFYDEGKTLFYRARIKAKIASFKQQKPMVEVSNRLFGPSQISLSFMYLCASIISHQVDGSL